MNTVTIKISLHNGYDQPPRLVDWQAIPTQITGLFITRPRAGYWKDITTDEPAKSGWYLTHKSGWVVGPLINSLPKAKALIKALDTVALNWDRPIEELQAEYKVYLKAVQTAWESTFI
jgi:hypothetical protein